MLSVQLLNQLNRRFDNQTCENEKREIKELQTKLTINVFKNSRRFQDKEQECAEFESRNRYCKRF